MTAAVAEPRCSVDDPLPHAGAAGGLACAWDALVRLYPAQAAGVTSGLGVLIAPRWVLTCEHVGSPRTNDYRCALMKRPQATAPVTAVYLEGAYLGIASERFVSIFAARRWTERDYLNERLALLQLAQPLAPAVAFPTIGKGHASSGATLIRAAHAAAGGPRAAITGLHFTAHRDGNCVLARIEDSRALPRGGDSGAPIMCGSERPSELFAIQNAISIDHARKHYAAIAVPVERALAWIGAIRSIHSGESNHG